MEDSTGIEVTEVVLIAMLAMFLLSTGVFFFFLAYQRRILKQQKEHQAKEAEYQQQLLRANFLSQERERNRIGKDLHDSVGAMLSTSKLYFRHLSQQVDANKFDELKQKALNLLDETMTSVRRVSHDLKPVVLERLGLVEAIANMADQLSESGGITVHFNNEWSCEMDKEYELNWFRIMQELLNNTIKHADANEITIGLSGDAEKVWLLYNDNGVGLKNNAVPKTGLGIQNIISRLSLMRGELKYNDNQESGISIVLYSDTRPRIIEKTYDAFYTTK